MLTNLSTYGYIILFLYSFGGGFIAIVAAGVLSFMGEMNLYISMLVAFSANFIGDTTLFYMSRYHKSDVMKYIHKQRRKLALSHLLLKKHGSWIIIMQKFVYGIKTLIPLAIGLTKYDFTKFTILNLVGSAIWALAFGFGSYASGEALMKTFEVISEKPYIAPIILVVVGGTIWLYMEKMTKKR
jgi:membrane protein DedA with SNARE-associated domain